MYNVDVVAESDVADGANVGCVEGGDDEDDGVMVKKKFMKKNSALENLGK